MVLAGHSVGFFQRSLFIVMPLTSRLLVRYGVGYNAEYAVKSMDRLAIKGHTLGASLAPIDGLGDTIALFIIINNRCSSSRTDLSVHF